MNDTALGARFAGTDPQAKTRQAAEAAVQALDSLHAVSPGAADLIGQAAAGYLDGVGKLALLSQAILLKQMTGGAPPDTSKQQAIEDAIGVLATDHLMGIAAAIAAAAGAIAAGTSSFPVDQIDHNIAKYAEFLRKGGG
ncbi:hypothetical protein [Lysobacter capsici]|uniref:hypothetical protein n=1 Tax=Lysobacter capsici TaxID=435897 RepID=UPI001C00429C|nr:hypothetical protein [Lysobacter capsici]QWF15229.1 hypothetical protein KME82_15645 [Lysobacter capsici]